MDNLSPVTLAILFVVVIVAVLAISFVWKVLSKFASIAATVAVIVAVWWVLAFTNSWEIVVWFWDQVITPTFMGLWNQLGK